MQPCTTWRLPTPDTATLPPLTRPPYLCLHLQVLPSLRRLRRLDLTRCPSGLMEGTWGCLLENLPLPAPYPSQHLRHGRAGSGAGSGGGSGEPRRVLALCIDAVRSGSRHLAVLAAADGYLTLAKPGWGLEVEVADGCLKLPVAARQVGRGGAAACSNLFGWVRGRGRVLFCLAGYRRAASSVAKCGCGCRLGLHHQACEWVPHCTGLHWAAATSPGAVHPARPLHSSD